VCAQSGMHAAAILAKSPKGSLLLGVTVSGFVQLTVRPCCSLIVRGGTRLAIRLRLACGPADREGGLELAAHCEVGEERGGRAGDEVRVGLGLGLGLGLGFRLGG
jgi:hypothetical protein